LLNIKTKTPTTAKKILSGASIPIIPVPISSHTAPSPTGEGWDEGLNKKLIGIGISFAKIQRFQCRGE
jgi:hypothetical protein